MKEKVRVRVARIGKKDAYYIQKDSLIGQKGWSTCQSWGRGNWSGGKVFFDNGREVYFHKVLLKKL